EGQSRIAGQQVAHPAKPGEKCSQRHRIDDRHGRMLRAMSACWRVRAGMNKWASAMQMKMKRQMPMVSAQQKRKHAECEPNGETDEIEIGPCHRDRLPSLSLEISPRSGCSASSNRSASPGVSKIAPSSRKQLRVSFWRAALISTSL